MEIQFCGANCIRITTKKSTIVVDDNLAELGLQTVVKDGDTLVFTNLSDPNINKVPKLLITQPGEYEVSDTSIVGIPARGYKDEPSTLNNTIYKIECDEIKVVVFGNAFPDLNDSQIEMLGEVNILIIPVGGNDTTLSGTDALKVIRKIEPFIVVPTNYDDPKVKYSSPQQPLESAIKELAMEPQETVAKFKIKPNTFGDEESTHLIVIERT